MDGDGGMELLDSAGVARLATSDKVGELLRCKISYLHGLPGHIQQLLLGLGETVEHLEHLGAKMQQDNHRQTIAESCIGAAELRFGGKVDPADPAANSIGTCCFHRLSSLPRYSHGCTSSPGVASYLTPCVAAVLAIECRFEWCSLNPSSEQSDFVKTVTGGLQTAGLLCSCCFLVVHVVASLFFMLFMLLFMLFMLLLLCGPPTDNQPDQPETTAFATERPWTTQRRAERPVW